MSVTAPARPGRKGRDTGAPPSCQSCRDLGTPWATNCPHVRARDGQPVVHIHSSAPADPACFVFLVRQVRGEAPEIGPAVGLGQRATRVGGLEAEKEKFSRAMTDEPRYAADTPYTHRPYLTASGVAFERATALFPGLAVLLDEATQPGRRRTPALWLRDVLRGRDVSDVAARSGRTTDDVQLAVYALSRRLCRNDLPRRFRDDLAYTRGEI